MLGKTAGLLSLAVNTGVTVYVNIGDELLKQK